MPPTALMRGRELLQFLLQSSVGRGRALDIGCGEGAFGRGLLAAGFEQVWGVEPNQLAAACAARVITGLVSSAFPNDGLDHISPFDLVIFADSLEHMIDPWAALAKARALLKPDGVLLLSLPNVGHYSVLRDLLMGRWTYADEGAAGPGSLTVLHANDCN